MNMLAPIVLLVAAIVLPVALFWLLRARTRFNGWVAASIAVAVGWALNLAWATVGDESIAVAARFGWVCPLALVLITWFAMRLSTRRAA